MNPARMPIRVVLYRDGDDWVAHCLEFDLFGHGPSRVDAAGALAQAIEIQIDATRESRNLNNLIHPAPSESFIMFARGAAAPDAEFRVASDPEVVEIERAELREYAAAEVPAA